MKYLARFILFISILLLSFGFLFSYKFLTPKKEPIEKAPEVEEVLEPLVSEPQEEIIEVVIAEPEPVTEIIEEPEPQIISLGIYKITAYCGCEKCCGNTHGITASGTHVTAGRTIAAPSNFAFGTELIINGHTYTVEDRGGAIKGNRIDIYFESHEEALRFGVQYLEVFKVIK